MWVQSSTINNQWFLPPKFTAVGEFITMKSHSPERFYCLFTVLDTFGLIPFPNAKALHGGKVPVTITSISFVVDSVVALDVCPNNS